MKKILFLFAAAPVLLGASCRKDDKEVGGKGGNATLNVTPQHHGKNIDSLTVYIKYDALDAPGSYDDSARCVLIGGVPVARFEGLKKGNYYLLGRGWDKDIVQNVKGGIPYVITEEKSINVILPVSEDH